MGVEAVSSVNRTARAAQGTVTSIVQILTRSVVEAALPPLILVAGHADMLGAYAALMQGIAYIAFVDLGFGTALNRYLPRALGSEGGMYSFRSVFSMGRTYIAATNFAAATLSLIFSLFVGRVLHLNPALAAQSRYSLYIFAAWTVIRTPISLYGPALVACQNMATNNVICASGYALRLGMSVILLHFKLGIIGLALSYVMAEGLTFLAHRVAFRRIVPDFRPEWGFGEPGLFREIFSFGIQAMVINVCAAITLYSGTIISSNLFGAALASVYYTTQMPIVAAGLIAWKIVDSSAAAINELAARGDTARLQSAYLRIVRYTFLVIFSSGIVLIGFSQIIVSLWVGRSQYAGHATACVLVIFIINATMNHINAIFLFAFGRLKGMTIPFLLSGLFNVILGVVLGRTMGLLGIALATLVELPVLAINARGALRVLHISSSTFWQRSIRPALLSVCIPAIPVVFILLFPTWRLISLCCYASATLSLIVICGLFIGLQPLERSGILALVYPKNA